MNIYEAMLKAADYIEAHPHVLNMHCIEIPNTPGGNGCALGWTGYFLGLKGQVYKEIHPLIGVKTYTCAEYFARMNALDPSHGRGIWFESAERLANVMRLYARKYHAPVIRSDSELVADLVRKISIERIPEEA